MTISEKVSYIKGLADGLELDDNKESKILKAIIDVLDDISVSIAEIEDGCAEICEQLDAVDEDLSTLEDDFYEDDECCCDDDDDECCCEDDDCCYEIECPACNDVIYLDEDMIDEGSIKCPNCGTNLEFDFDDCECDDDSCSCGCCKPDEDKE